jgi:uncharacterized delta-60 repeat protein
MAMMTLALLMSSLPPARVEAASGDLDPTFGSGGKVTTNFDSFDRANAVAIQSDGKIVAAGFALTITSNDFALVRYNSDGSLDASFGAGGKVTTDFFGTRDEAHAVAIQDDGKIVVAGGALSFSVNTFLFSLARYNSDGSLDASFGTGGKVATNFGNGAGANAIAIQSDGKIVIGGGAFLGNGTQNDFALLRYNTNGALDTSFGASGKVTTDFFARDDRVNALAIQGDGKIVAAGVASPMLGAPVFALARYDDFGNLDPTFDTDGKVTADLFGLAAVANALAIQSDGKIVAAGATFIDSVFVNTPLDFALARYTGNGTPDPTFGTGGKITTDFFGSTDSANAVVIQSDGKIISAGFAAIPFVSIDFALARYTNGGALDTSFGTGGRVTTAFGQRAFANGAAIQSDGKIVAAGVADATFYTDFALARYGASAFDRCLQADSGNLFLFNSTTGDYLFTDCLGVTVSGRGTVIIKGSIITLQHYAFDRRVTASLDVSAGKGTATVQLFSPARTFTISDRDTSNNTCSCS